MTPDTIRNEISEQLKRRFVVTLKTAIKIAVPRMDGTELIIKTTTLLVDWPCRFAPHGNDIEPREGPHVDLTVIRFAREDDASWFQFWKTEDGLTDPLPVQIKRDNILSRQEIPKKAK